MQCWILSNLRSGSNYLASLLNNALPGDDLLTEKFRPETVTRRQFTRSPANFERTVIHSIHYHRVFGKRRHDYIERFLPRVRYIRLDREDKIAQAVSLYVARETRVWVLADQPVADYQRAMPAESYLNRTVAVDDTRLRRAYEDVQAFDDWTAFLGRDGRCLDVTYEDLAAAPADALGRALDFLDLPVRPETLVTSSNVRKVERPETVGLAARLRQLVTDADAADSRCPRRRAGWPKKRDPR